MKLIGKVPHPHSLSLSLSLSVGCRQQKKQLLETRRVGQNVDEAIETLQACLRVLDLANRVGSLIEAKKYYAALRVSAAFSPACPFFSGAHLT